MRGITKLFVAGTTGAAIALGVIAPLIAAAASDGTLAGGQGDTPWPAVVALTDTPWPIAGPADGDTPWPVAGPADGDTPWPIVTTDGDTPWPTLS